MSNLIVRALWWSEESLAVEDASRKSSNVDVSGRSAAGQCGCDPKFWGSQASTGG
jgi:hypothetical protein